MRVKLVAAILVLLAIDLLPSPVHAEGVVTVCDEPHLLAALVGGGRVTFACSGTITLTEPIIVDTDTTQTDPVSGHDQRGVMRPVGPHCDIGAVEVNYLPTRQWFPLTRVQ